MKPLLAFSAILAIASVACPAFADAYAWGGESGRFQVAVTLPGFNDGAGATGWEEGSARRFAAWTRRFNSVIPRDAFVSLESDDDASVLTIRRGGHTHLVRMAGDPDLEAALPLVAGHFGVPVPGPATAGKLYTLQLFASTSEASAARFAAGIDERGVAAEGSFFYEACLPCSIREVRVLGPGAGGVHRVITGIFDRYSVARRALGELRSRSGLEGFVREI
jgi:hypothetical protein